MTIEGLSNRGFDGSHLCRRLERITAYPVIPAARQADRMATQVSPVVRYNRGGMDTALTSPRCRN
jgi:hypothetical protein